MEIPGKGRIRFASRVTQLQPSPTLAVMNRASELTAMGIGIIDFGPGEPDFNTPPLIAAAAKKAIDDGFTRYTNVAGCAELRAAVAGSYNRRYGSNIRKENVIVGTGGKQELFNLMLSLVDEGDEVIIPSPYWVSFPDQVAFAGGVPVFAPTDPENFFRPTLENIEGAASPKTRGVIINSPCNPTGAVISENELDRIIAFCHARDMFLIFDETYEFFVYGERSHVSAIRWLDRYPDTVIVVNSMSKTFAMTGWRLGFAIAHPDIVAACGKIQSHSTSNPSSISQFAAIEALNGGNGEVRKMYEAYVERRAWLVPALSAIPGFDCMHPDGAFYLFPSVRSLYGRKGISGSAALADYFLEEARVAVVPGEAFGADDYIRLSYATGMDALREGVSRLHASVARLLA